MCPFILLRPFPRDADPVTGLTIVTVALAFQVKTEDMGVLQLISEQTGTRKTWQEPNLASISSIHPPNVPLPLHLPTATHNTAYTTSPRMLSHFPLTLTTVLALNFTVLAQIMAKCHDNTNICNCDGKLCYPVTACIEPWLEGRCKTILAPKDECG